jgi:hypothetical protein
VPSTAVATTKETHRSDATWVRPNPDERMRNRRMSALTRSIQDRFLRVRSRDGGSQFIHGFSVWMTRQATLARLGEVADCSR